MLYTPNGRRNVLVSIHYALLGLVIFTVSAFPQHAVAETSPKAFPEAQSLINGELSPEEIGRFMNLSTIVDDSMARSMLIPQNPPIPSRTIQILVTAYSSTADQTDSTPFTTASGTRVRDGVAAANCLAIGTKVRIPGKFGNKIFIVEDRMNARFKCTRFDIWMPTRAQAMQFGMRKLTIEVL